MASSTRGGESGKQRKNARKEENGALVKRRTQAREGKGRRGRKEGKMRWRYRENERARERRVEVAITIATTCQRVGMEKTSNYILSLG